MKYIIALGSLLFICVCSQANDIVLGLRILHWDQLRAEVTANRAAWQHLYLTDFPASGSSGELAMHAARKEVLSSGSVSENVRRELNVAIADQAARNAARP